MSEGPGKNLEEMDKEMRKSFALKTEILGGDPGDVKSLMVSTDRSRGRTARSIRRRILDIWKSWFGS